MVLGFYPSLRSPILADLHPELRKLEHTLLRKTAKNAIAVLALIPAMTETIYIAKIGPVKLIRILFSLVGEKVIKLRTKH
jgi:hypothetical protein